MASITLDTPTLTPVTFGGYLCNRGIDTHRFSSSLQLVSSEEH